MDLAFFFLNEPSLLDQYLSPIGFCWQETFNLKVPYYQQAKTASTSKREKSGNARIKRYIFFPLECNALFPFPFVGLNVSVCFGLQRWVGRHHVWWTGCCGSGSAGMCLVLNSRRARDKEKHNSLFYFVKTTGNAVVQSTYLSCNKAKTFVLPLYLTQYSF